MQRDNETLLDIANIQEGKAHRTAEATGHDLEGDACWWVRIGRGRAEAAIDQVVREMLERERVIRAMMTSPWLILSGLGLALLLLGCGVGLYAGASFAWGGQDWFPASDPWSRMLWAGRTGVFIFGLGLLTAITMAAALAGQTRFQRRKNRKYEEERDD